MALFDTSNTEITLHGTGGITTDEREIMRICGKFSKLSRAIGEIRHGQTTHFITKGSWALHDLLKYVLSQTGPAQVKGFTWSISMPAATMLLKLLESGRIEKMWLITDGLMTKWSAAALAVLNPHCEKIALTGNHSKGFIVSNAEWKISVISSANFSNNPRIEGGSISTNPDVYRMHEEWIDRILENADPFEEEPADGIETGTGRSGAALPERVLFLVRGLPGAGKSTTARLIADAVFENDDYFTQNGVYKFKATDLPKASSTCFNNVRDAMENGVPRVAVANVFADARSMEKYITLAGVMGYSVVPLIVENRDGRANIHGVPEETIAGMRSRFEVKLC
ncbi:hypothetical protein [Victivallis vadensis]|uniref:hypothetical protein n=1 Tax=Victivallis vadensis TaxID=172901 RepID=UPI0023F9853C|nr:hypothetical protein [Victivallis vadensis]